MIIGMMPFSYECLNTSDASCTLKFRGMGDSSYRSDDEITIEVLSRDLLFLIESLRWKDVSICGFSMGGRLSCCAISPLLN